MKYKEYLNKDRIFIVIIAVCCAYFILYSPFKYHKVEEHEVSTKIVFEKARVKKVDNSYVSQLGIIKTGDQILEVEIISGKYKGEVKEASNHLFGKMELDEIFSEGDYVLVGIGENREGEIQAIRAYNHFRSDTALYLLLLFSGTLIFFAGKTGAKALLSFVFTGLAIWKVLIPLFLKGFNPILLALCIVTVLTAVIVFLVGGINKKGFTALLGSFFGISITCLLSIYFGHLFKLHGAVKQYSETLIYAGFAHLNITDIFLAGIFLASSGAVMDIAMDIAAAQNEIVLNSPGISRRKLIISGMNVGKPVIGTMTTTLLLAYSGGFTSMLMLYLAEGRDFEQIININYVSAEILHTLVGSFGLISVAPMTALTGGIIFRKKKG